jgi:predicted metalloprotease
MKWTNDRADNVDDRRGSGGGGMLVGGGLGTLIIAAIIFFLGGDPSAILSNGVGNAPQTEQRELTAEELQVKEFVRMLSAENNQTWTKIFSENGMQYREPKIVLFENVTQSGCGTAQAAMGPFYCPADETVYMDMSFFGEMQQKLSVMIKRKITSTSPYLRSFNTWMKRFRCTSSARHWPELRLKKTNSRSSASLPA